MIALRILLFLLAALALPLASAAAHRLEPYALLREAYAERRAARAAQAYTDHATMAFEYRSAPPERHVGRDTIRDAFERMFAEWSRDAPVDLNFRITRSSGASDSGWYRLRVGGQSACGRFEVRLHRVGARWRFGHDRSVEADCAEFEEAAAPLAFAADSTPLDPAFHDALLGRYRGADGRVARITRSQWRLQWEDEVSGERRSLLRIDGSTWQARERFAAGAATATLRFDPPGADGGRPGLAIGPWRAERLPDAERSEAVQFVSADGTRLAGELRLPARLDRPGSSPSRHAGVVLLHGSGAQDRHGHAGLMRRLGDAFVEAGVAVLSYDKRGTGGSGGDFARAPFALLARDAAAAMALLAAHPRVDPARVGLAGSSQAGWVAARLVESGGRPAHVLLLGAAGAGVTVVEQHRWHTTNRLRCEGAGDTTVRRTLARDEARFARRATLPDAPPSKSAEPPPWYEVLELHFDPLPAWRAHSIPLLAIVFEHDDATPSTLVAQRLAGASGVEVVQLQAADHLGMAATDRCRPMEDAFRWHAELWPRVQRWARGR
jgi:hypothetical protein